MKIRARFSKEGKIKFIGHLDLLRLFQRVIKSAEIPIAYSQGFNPHSLIYFAQPLSVGVTSSGEYIDIQLEKSITPELVKEKMNAILPEGLLVQSVNILPENSKAAMTLIDAAEYEIRFDKEDVANDFVDCVQEFYNQEEILVTKTTKKKERTINIKEFIYDLAVREREREYVIDVILATGSRNNLNPDLFLQPFIEANRVDGTYDIHRKDLLSVQDENFVSLSQLGE